MAQHISPTGSWVSGTGRFSVTINPQTAVVSIDINRKGYGPVVYVEGNLGAMPRVKLIGKWKIRHLQAAKALLDELFGVAGADILYKEVEKSDYFPREEAHPTSRFLNPPIYKA